MGGGKPLLEGWLIKSPPLNSSGLKRWHKRWVVLLQSKILEYYEDKKKSKTKGTVNLEDCISVKTDLRVHKSKGKFMFCVEMPDRQYFFCATSKEQETEWVSKIVELCEFPVTEASGSAMDRSSTMAGPSRQKKTNSAAAAMGNGSMTLPAGGKLRAHTVQNVSSPTLSLTSQGSAAARHSAGAAVNLSTGVANAPTTPNGEYFLVGEGTNVSDGPTGTGQPGALPLENGDVDRHLSQRVTSMHLGRPMTNQEMAALQSYDIVPPADPEAVARRQSRNSMRTATRQQSAPVTGSRTSPERYVDLPTAQAQMGIMPGIAIPEGQAARNPYQYPPPPRRAEASSSAPGTMMNAINHTPSPEDPRSAYSILPPTRAATTSPDMVPPRPGGYATLGPDDLMASPPPSIDRSSKPRKSIDSVGHIVDPDAPPVDRVNKPIRSMHSSGAFDLDGMDGMEFEQMPVPTTGSKRFSRVGYYDVPPVAVGVTTAMLQQQVGHHLSGVPVVDSRFSQADPRSNYDIPPNLQLATGAGQPQLIMAGQLPPGVTLIPVQGGITQQQMYNFDQLQGQPVNPMENYDFPPGTGPRRGTMSTVPSQHYSYPPNASPHRSMTMSMASPPSQHYDYPPPTSTYDYPPPAHGGTRLSVGGVRSTPSPPDANYSIPPPPVAAAGPQPMSNYSYLPHPVKATGTAIATGGPMDSYSVPPAAVAAPARPDKPAALSAAPIKPFDPAEFGQGQAVNLDQEYMVMGGDGTVTAFTAAAIMDDQYTDMSKLAEHANGQGMSVGEQIIAARDSAMPPRPPKP